MYALCKIYLKNGVIIEKKFKATNETSKEDAIEEMKDIETELADMIKSKHITGSLSFGSLIIRASELIAFDYDIIEE